MKAAIQHGDAMPDLPLQHVRASIIQPDTLVPGGDEEVVAVVREAEVGDAVGRGVRELLAAAGRRRSCGHGGGGGA